MMCRTPPNPKRPASMERGVMSDSKIVIATGGGRGVGRETVRRLARRGIRSIHTDKPDRADV
jgi:NAD(P)-dependent dehydrogenase (short-subunit alcohol dehydrogenase family)